jgi:hypothetical protein
MRIGVERISRMDPYLAITRRLVDFLEEDVSSYPDGQLGAAVRRIHSSCYQVLDRYIKLEPVFLPRETILSPCRGASIRQL